MKKLISRLCAAAIIFGTVAGGLAAPTQGEARARLAAQEALDTPIVTLAHWQASNRHDKLSFLLGFVTMLGMEREWQAKSPLPIKQSIVGTWVKGLDGIALGDISDTLDRYAAEHPDEGGKPILEALGEIYIRPKMTKGEREQAATRWVEIKESK